MSGGCQVGVGVFSAPPSMPVSTQRGFPCWKTLSSAFGARISSCRWRQILGGLWGRGGGWGVTQRYFGALWFCFHGFAVT